MRQPDHHHYGNAFLSTPGRPGRRSLQDADIVVPFVLFSPVFLAVVVRTLMRGDAFGVESTVCAAIVVAALAMLVASLRARRGPELS